MFVKNSLALQDAVDHILIIFERLIVNLGGLEEAAKLQQWRDAVRDIRGELEAVRSIANRTDNVPHMLIGMDKPSSPPLSPLPGHPWLLTVEQWFNAGLLTANASIHD
ncbi:hypothetical protein F5141DRAFT_1065494 [Pisolithus sp. B1]|nr:hypothetical protein F5141DRAFT_1065494 [Pisolithus sp. B1]